MKSAFHLDAGRKFFGVPALKTIIDTLAEANIDFFQLYLTDNQGFRFALDDMTGMAAVLRKSSHKPHREMRKLSIMLR